MRCSRTFGMAMLLLIACMGWAAAAAEQFPSGPNHRGVAPFEPYLVFPENRPGNGVYLDNRLVFESRDQIVVDVLALPAEGRFAYYALDAQGTGALGVSLKPNDAKPRIDEVTPGFYQVVLVMDGVVYKKLYRIIEHNILDLLPSSKTADGPTAGPVGVLFYHVATAIRETEDGQTKRGFGLKLHLALFDDDRTRHLDYLITNALPELKITWLDESRVEVGLADGRTQILSLSQFQ
jgi:hypothetical protein